MDNNGTDTTLLILIASAPRTGSLASGQNPTLEGRGGNFSMMFSSKFKQLKRYDHLSPINAITRSMSTDLNRKIERIPRPPAVRRGGQGASMKYLDFWVAIMDSYIS